jgi:hypothetical protein
MKLSKSSAGEIGKTIRDAIRSNSKTVRLVVLAGALILTVSVGCAIQSGYQTITITVTRHQ